MCIISGVPQRISDTQILAFPTADCSQQVTVYSNKVDLRTPDATNVVSAHLPEKRPWWRKLGSRRRAAGTDHQPAPSTPFSQSEPVAMILPFPEGECEVIDTSDCNNLFQTLDRWFPEPLPRASRGYGGGYGAAQSLSAMPKLDVKRCGSYQYSVVPTLADFGRVDESVFKLDDNVAGLLARAYATEFSFLVCIIDKSAKYQPIAYRHPLRAGPAGRHELFIPTMHEHGNGRADWDHAVYVIGSDLVGRAADGDCSDLGKKLPKEIGQYVPAGVQAEMFRKRVIRGRHPNADMVVPLLEAAAAA